MAVTTQVTPNGSVAPPDSEVITIKVSYDEKTLAVTVKPDNVHKGETARFINPDGDQLRVVFVSPLGNQSDQVIDTDSYTFDVGGAYHFNCFFTPQGSTKEIKGTTGGVLDVLPHRP